MTDNEIHITEDEIIGHVVGEGDDAVTVCAECYDGGSDGAIYNSVVYGAQVPYPECYICGEVLRPERE